MTIPPFETTFEVMPADIDERDHVNNVVYVRWVNDVAIMHWRSGATIDQQADLAWVLMRYDIDELDAAHPGDRVRACTWVGHAEGLKFERFVELTRVADGKVLAHSKTIWCPVDGRTGRPKRVPAAVRERFSEGLP